MYQLIVKAQQLWPQLTVIAAVVASHMSMPNHWLPYSIVARAHCWSLQKALLLTIIGAAGHATATLIFVLVVSHVGGAFISHDTYTRVASFVMMLLGIYYLWTYWIGRKRNSCCDTNSHQMPILSTSLQSDMRLDSAAVDRAAAISLISLTTLSPCVGSMPVLISVLAPPRETNTVILAAFVLFFMSAFVMTSLVGLSFVGVSSLDFAKVRRHERCLLGSCLLILAILTMFVFSNDHHHHHNHGNAMKTHQDEIFISSHTHRDESSKSVTQHQLDGDTGANVADHRQPPHQHASHML